MNILRSVVLTLSLVSIATTAGGCYRGYASASDLESSERGPADCHQSCEDLGMRMAAFVLVQNNVSGCVCEPTNVQGQRSGSIGAVAGGHVVIEAAREQQQQQQQQQTSAQ